MVSSFYEGVDQLLRECVTGGIEPKEKSRYGRTPGGFMLELEAEIRI